MAQTEILIEKLAPLTVLDLEKMATPLYNNGGLPQLCQIERFPDGVMIDFKDEVEHTRGEFLKGLSCYYQIKKVIACRQSQSDVDLFWHKVICFQVKL